MKTQCSEGRLIFHDLESREVVARFDGGEITSDAGAVLLRGLGQDDGEDGHVAVGGHRCRPARCELALDVGAVDAGDGHVREPGQNLSAQAILVHVQRLRLPHPRVAPEDGLRNNLELDRLR